MNDIKVPKDTSAYKEHYSDSKFWDKVKSLGKNVLKPAMLLYYVMKSSDVPFATKAAITGALGYLILPLDLVPDFIPVAGYADDTAALWAIVENCQSYFSPEIKAFAEAKLNDLLG